MKYSSKNKCSALAWKDENGLFEREARIDFHMSTFLRKLLMMADHMSRNETMILSYPQPSTAAKPEIQIQGEYM